MNSGLKREMGSTYCPGDVGHHERESWITRGLFFDRLLLISRRAFTFEFFRVISTNDQITY